jgi:hypothetical protein
MLQYVLNIVILSASYNYDVDDLFTHDLDTPVAKGRSVFFHPPAPVCCQWGPLPGQSGANPKRTNLHCPKWRKRIAKRGGRGRFGMDICTYGWILWVGGLGERGI